MYDFDRANELISMLRPNSTWEEIAIELNHEFNLDLDESTYRKNFMYFQSGEEIKRQIAIERQKLRFERTKNYELTRDIALKSMLEEDVREAIRSKAKVQRFSPIRLSDREITPDIYNFVTSDFHYDGEENQLSVLRTVENHILEQQRIHGFKQINLFELGDVIDGAALRTSQLMSIKKGMVFQILDVAKVYVHMLEELSKHMQIKFYCVTSSNHTQLRPLGTKQNQLVEEDLMHVFAQYIELAMSKNENVRVEYGEEMLVHITPKHTLFVAHGHLIRHKEGYLQDVAAHRDMHIDYGLFGHFHHYREITLYAGKGYNKKVFYAPSMSTAESQYEKDKNLSSCPAALMLVFNEDRGHCYSQELFV